MRDYKLYFTVGNESNSTVMCGFRSGDEARQHFLKNFIPINGLKLKVTKVEWLRK